MHFKLYTNQFKVKTFAFLPAVFAMMYYTYIYACNAQSVRTSELQISALKLTKCHSESIGKVVDSKRL